LLLASSEVLLRILWSLIVFFYNAYVCIKLLYFKKGLVSGSKSHNFIGFYTYANGDQCILIFVDIIEKWVVLNISES